MSERRSRSLDPAELAAVRRPVARASTLPGAPYHAPEILAAEMEEIFGRMWICAGHGASIPGPGDLLLREIAGESVIVVRGRDGGLRAFHNVCRHRGTRLLDRGDLADRRADAVTATGRGGAWRGGDPAGTAPGEDTPGAPGGDGGEVCHPIGRGFERIRCPYHSWTYDLDGSLRSAPLMDDAEGFDRADFPLRPVRLETWEGFLFLNLDGDAGSLDDQLADLPDLGRWEISGMKPGARCGYEVEANWKVVCENYGECYHCPTNHPQLEAVTHFRNAGESFDGVAFSGGPMRLNEGHRTMTLSGDSDRPDIEGLREHDRSRVHYFNVYPTLLLSLCVDYVLTHTVWPLGPERSRVECEWLFPAAVADAAGFDPSDAVEFWDLTNRQDWRLCARAQKGLRSRAYRPGRYNPMEESVWAFDRWYVERMGDRLLAAGRTADDGRSAHVRGLPERDEPTPRTAESGRTAEQGPAIGGGGPRERRP